MVEDSVIRLVKNLTLSHEFTYKYMRKHNLRIYPGCGEFFLNPSDKLLTSFAKDEYGVHLPCLRNLFINKFV